MPLGTSLGIAIIGCGHWGRNYVRLLRSLGTSPLLVCDLARERLEEIARQHPGVETTSDHSQALAHDGIDAVIVATTAAHHHGLARDALAAGKHVLVEKPFTLHSSEGLELVAQAESAGRTLMVAHTFLYNPAIRAMRDLVRRGEAGAIYYLHATRTHLGLVRPDVNAVWDLAPHDISIFSYLLDKEPISVAATGGRYLSREREDAAFINIHYPHGVIGSIFVSWVDSNKMREVALIGSRARIVFDDLNAMERLKIFHKGVSLDRPYQSFGEFQLLMRDGDIVSPRVEATEPLRVMIDHFVECCLQTKPPLTGGRDGIAVVRVLEAIDQSLAAGGTPVSLAPELPT